jgi:hypothetical protein
MSRSEQTRPDPVGQALESELNAWRREMTVKLEAFVAAVGYAGRLDIGERICRRGEQKEQVT